MVALRFLPINVFCLLTQWDIIKAALPDSMRLCCQGKETDLGAYTSAAVDWKWCIKLLSVCECIASCAWTLEVVVSHLNLCVTQSHHMVIVLFYNLAPDINMSDCCPSCTVDTSGHHIKYIILDSINLIFWTLESSENKLLHIVSFFWCCWGRVVSILFTHWLPF